MSEPTTARKYYVGMDFLKAFAAIFIVLHHYQQYTGTYYEDSFNFFPLMDSQLHVGYLTILYFMISGFFAESQELREDARGQFKSLPGKFWHKCLRIYPVAIVACVTYIGLGVLHWAATRDWIWPAGGGGLWTMFCSITLSGYMGILEPAKLVFNAPTWYLSTLVFACAVYYLLVYVSRRCKIPRVLLELILFLFLCAAKMQGTVIPFLGDEWDQKGGMISFFMGTLLCRAVPYIPRKLKYFFLLVSAGTLVVLFSGRGDWIETQWWVQLFLLYPGIFMNALYIQGDPDSKLCKVIRFFGNTSFDVYVWHCPIFMAEMVLLDILGVSLPCTYGVMTVFVVAVELLAIPLYLFVEKPLAQYSRRWEWDKLKIVDPV